MSSLHDQMFSEVDNKEIFKKAQSYAFEYQSKARDRNVYPNQIDLDNLAVFDEKLPTKTGNAGEVIDLLHKYGSPATVTQTAGRYFGFVNGK